MTRLRDFWESEFLRKFMLGFLVFLVVALLALIVWQNENHHASSSKQLDAILQAQTDHAKTLDEVAALQREFTQAVTKGLPALEGGQAEISNAFVWLDCALSTSASSCGPPPKVSP